MKSFSWGWVAVLAISGGALLAQWQVNPRVNNSVYSTESKGSVRFSYGSSSVATPGEVRHAYYTSGALPSEIRANQNAIGPLSGGGAMDYIPKKAPPARYMPSAQGASAYTGSVSKPKVRNGGGNSAYMPSATSLNNSFPSTKIR